MAASGKALVIKIWRLEEVDFRGVACLLVPDQVEQSLRKVWWLIGTLHSRLFLLGEVLWEEPLPLGAKEEERPIEALPERIPSARLCDLPRTSKFRGRDEDLTRH